MKTCQDDFQAVKFLCYITGMAGAYLFVSATTKNESSMILIVGTEFHITYMADLSATTKIEILMITVCWTEFHITYMAELSATTKIETLMITICWADFHIKIRGID